MSMDVSQLAIEVISKGIDAATKSLNALADASERVESKTITVTSATKESAEAITTATATASSYIDKLQTKVVLLGKNQEQVAHYTAVTKGLTEAEVSHAASLGAQLDAWKALGVAQAEAIKINKEYDANKRAIVEAEEAANARYKQIAQDAMTRAHAQDEANRAARESVRVNQESAKYSEDVSKAQSAQMASAKGLADAQERAANSSGKQSRANKAVELSAGEMLTKLDPLARSLDKLDVIQAKLNQEFQKGEISAKMYNDQLAKLESHRSDVFARQQELAARGTNSFSEALKSFSLSSVMAQRELLVMGREIARGDWTRFAGSATIFADRAGLMNAALIGLRNPLTWVVAGVGAYAAASAIGAQESVEFNKALIMTGNYVGTTANQMQDMAKGLSGIAGQHQAAAVLAEVAATGKFTHEQFQLVSKSALEMEHATGKAVQDTVKEFEEIGKSPVEASIKLDNQYHYLTTSVYEQIRALEEQGKHEEAVNLAMHTYADSIDQRTPQVIDNLGNIEKAWKGIRHAITATIDAALDWGRAKSLVDQKADIEDKLQNYNPFSLTGPSKSDLQARLDDLNKQIFREKELQDLRNEQAETDRKGFDGLKASDRRLDSMRGEVRLQKEINQITQDYINMRKNLESRPDDKALQERLKGVQFDADGNPYGGGAYAEEIKNAERHNSIAEPRKNEYGIDAELKKLDGKMKERERILSVGLTHTKALYEQGILTQREYIDSEYAQTQMALEDKAKLATKEIEIAKSKKNTAALEERKNALKAIQDEMLANEQKHSDSLAVMDAKREAATKAFTAKLKTDYEDRQYAINSTLSGAGLGAAEREELSRIQAVQHAFDQQVKQLRAAKELGEGAKGGIGKKQYDDELSAAQTMLEQRIAQERKFTADKKKLDADWTSGASRALQNYQDSAHNVASSVETMFSNGFKNMEDALVTFVQTGKMNFSSLANSIISDLIRIQIRAMMGGSAGGGGGLLASIFGSLLSAGAGSATGAASAASTADYMVANAGGGLGLKMRAAGGPVWSGESFIVGERGPEVFTPSTQGTISPTGQGGVGGGQVAVTYSPTIHIDSRTDRNEVHALVTKAVRNGNAQLVDDLKRAGAIR